MADKQIKQLNEQTSINDSDKFPLQDGSTDETKFTLLSTLRTKIRTGLEYELLGRHLLSSSADTLTLSGLTAKKYLKIYCYIVRSGNVGTVMRFNGDTGTTYAFRRSDDFGAATASTSQTSIPWETGTSTSDIFGIAEIVNFASGSKIGHMHTMQSGGATGASAGANIERFIKWANTADQITQITITNDETGDFLAGSELIVYGHD